MLFIHIVPLLNDMKNHCTCIPCKLQDRIAYATRRIPPILEEKFVSASLHTRDSMDVTLYMAYRAQRLFAAFLHIPCARLFYMPALQAPPLALR
jgi:hypothetical protein